VSDYSIFVGSSSEIAARLSRNTYSINENALLVGKMFANLTQLHAASWLGAETLVNNATTPYRKRGLHPRLLRVWTLTV
jgi:hypothetical protein